MLHLVISCSCYLSFLLAKALVPTQPAAWRLVEHSLTSRNRKNALDLLIKARRN